MGDADFLISWPTINSTSFAWTLSHRSPNTVAARGEGQPVLASTDAATNTATFYTLVPELSTTDRTSPFTSVAYVRALDPGTSYPAPAGATVKLNTAGQDSFIYASASSSLNPQDLSENAKLSQHDNVRVFF
jgi:hypothetical protein